MRLVVRISVFYHPVNIKIDVPIEEKSEKPTCGFKVGEYDTEFPTILN